MDAFEKYIKENRDQFNDHKADKAKLWLQIESKLDTSETKSIKIWQSPLIKIAASIIIILSIFSGTSLYITSGINKNHQKNIVNRELQDIDTYYNGLVSFQVQLVKNNKKLLPKDKEEFLSFMSELDEEYNSLKEEMKQNLNNEYILEAIIKNYKKRIELIENLLRQINDQKNSSTNEEYFL